MNIELTAEQAEQFKKEGKITIEMPKEEVKPRLITGWWVDKYSNACFTEDNSDLSVNHNIYATKEQAEASIAQARLTQEMKLVNGDWVADFNKQEAKWVITFDNYNPVVGWMVSANRFLSFKDKQTATKFLSDHYDLIMAYKPLA